MDKDRPLVPYIIVELKKPKLTDGKEQLKSYCNATSAPIGVWTNGEQVSCYNRKDPNFFEMISDIPKASQKLSDILNEKYTYDDLRSRDKISKEKRSLRNLIKEMEDEVLASAGVDSFEEIFKLIFAKLYDELICANDKTVFLQFRNSGDTDFELKEKIQKLFDDAKKKWEGVFPEESKILLSPSHLAVCVSTLQDIKLFNNNLDVVDDAFEYLMSKAQKGEKGQYFTPRYVIDMCVKMMNPTIHDKIIDTACGSSGFTVHSIFKVWKEIRLSKGLEPGEDFTASERTEDERNYVRDNVFAIDFDEKTVRVARTLNLIAGDGQTNVLHLNTLDYSRWNEVIKQEEWNDTYNGGFKKLKKLQPSVGKYGRLDAEFYQPKYDQLFSELENFYTKPLGGKKGIVTIKKSIEPGSSEYLDKGIPFIRVSDMNKFGISEPRVYLSKENIYNLSELYPKKDTILFSKDGSVGIAYKMEKDDNIVTSGALLHLNVINTLEVLPDYLTLVLNSSIVQMQAERDTNGAIIQHWKPYG